MNKKQMIFLEDAPSVNQMPAKVIYGDSEECPPPVHWHENIEINFMTAGSWYINIDGQKKYVNQMQAEVVNSGAVHWITPIKQGQHKNLVVVFYMDFLKQFLPDIDDYIFLSPEEISKGEQIYKYLRRLYDIYQGMDKRKQQTEVVQGADQLEVKGLLYAIAFELVDAYKVRSNYHIRMQKSRYQERFKQACRFIDQNYGEDIGLKEVSDEIGISKEHCSRSFRQYLGVPFREYLTSVRLSHAYRLIIYSNLPIVEVAMHTGFADLRAFERSFLSMYHETPSCCRKRINRGGDSDVLHG